MRDLRGHGDLNPLTHQAFLAPAAQTGFGVEEFRVLTTRTGSIVRRLAPSRISGPVLEYLSTGAMAALAASAE